MSALPPKADMVRHGGNVRFVPNADKVLRSKLNRVPRPSSSNAAVGEPAKLAGVTSLGSSVLTGASCFRFFIVVRRSSHQLRA